MEALALYYPENHQLHSLYGHPERPERVEVIREALREIDLWDEVPHLDAERLNMELLTSVHDPDYLRLVEYASQRGQMLDPDTYATKHSWQLALNAAGGAVAVASSVWTREYGSGFALCRPPGHHATSQRAMGFCLINNIAVAAEHLLQNHHAGRIAIVDLDLHHGNGTQEIFYDRDDVSYLSVHQWPFYPGTGSLMERGEGKGEGSTLNLPIPGGSGDLAYETLQERIIYPFLEATQPQMLLVSYGFDTHWKDPLGSMLVSAGCTFRSFQGIKSWADQHCQGRLAVILEGGYDLDAARACGQAVAAALAGLEWTDSLGVSPEEETDEWRKTLEDAREIWGF
jgi:acetoin utilization deacetylase AcuC-like enzyme